MIPDETHDDGPASPGRPGTGQKDEITRSEGAPMTTQRATFGCAQEEFRDRP